jgi:hypothetical protein
VVGLACQQPTTAHGRMFGPACGDVAVARSLAATSRDTATVATCRPCAPHRLTRSPCPLQHSIKEAKHHFLPRDAKSHPLCSRSVCRHAQFRCARRATAASSCASVSTSTGGHLKPSRPPLGADQKPWAVRFLDRTCLAMVSHL